MSKQEKVTGFKGYDKDMKCRDKQYKEGEEYIENVDPKVCSVGMHFCKMPLDVFNYYPPKNGNIYTTVESTGDVDEEGDKISTNNLKVGGKISISKLFKIHFEIINSKIKSSTNTHITTGHKAHSSTTGEEAHSITTGNYAHSITTGNYAHSSTTGHKAHSSTTGYKAHSSTTGEEAVSSALGIRSKVSADKGWIVLVDWVLDEDYNWSIRDIYRAKVGKHKIKGVLIKPTVKYWFENGELKSEL